MHSHRKLCFVSLLSAATLAQTAAMSAAQAAGASPGSPATVAEAAKLLDLSTLPLASGAEQPQHRGVASLFYNAQGTTKDVFAFHRQQLTAQKWKELPSGYVSDQTASGTFTRDGYSLSLTVFPMGNAGMANVTITNHGNVDLKTLPVPQGIKPFFGGPVNASYITEASVEKTTDACRKLLAAQGWQPYGTAGDSLFFKKNAIRLMARIAAAPAQAGKTVIDYSTALMSADLPAPAETANLQYADVTKQLSFDSTSSEQDIAGFYRPTLAKAAWKATTEQPIKIDFKNVLIFRNPQKDMLTLEMIPVDGKTRVALKQQSAAEIAELELKLKVEAERYKAEKSKPLPKLVLSLPAHASGVKQTKNRIELNLAAGKAKAAVEAWRQQFTKDGWKAEVTTLEDMAGAITFRKGNQDLSIIYSDTGFLPAEITVQATGVELEQAAEKP